MLSNPSTRSNPPPPPSSPPITSTRACHNRESHAFFRILDITPPRCMARSLHTYLSTSSNHTALPPPHRASFDFQPCGGNNSHAQQHTLPITSNPPILPWSASTIGSHHHHIIIIACCQGNAHCFRWEALERARPGCEGVSVDCGPLGQTFGAWPS